MRIVFIGASSLTLITTETLLEAGHEVVIIEKDREVIELHSEAFDCSFIHGDGSKPKILEDVSPVHTDCLFCLSSDDTANILAAVVARSLDFNRVVILIEDQELLPVCKQLNLEHVIVPDRRISRELMAFAEGNEHALRSEAPESDSTQP